MVEKIAELVGTTPSELNFVLAATALILSFAGLVYLVRLFYHERTFAKVRRQHELDKEIFRRRSEVADLVVEQLEFVNKHLKGIIATNSLDNAEESLRWILSKQNSLNSLAFQIRRYFGKELAKRYQEILDKVKILGRYNEKEQTYEVFLLPRDEADQIFKRLIIKIDSIVEAVLQATDHVR